MADKLSKSKIARPSVILIGWTGHQPKHLLKYADLYTQLGYDTHAFSEHKSALLNTSWRMDLKYGQQVADLVRATQATTVHVFSNGGAWVWKDALNLARDTQKQLEKRGLAAEGASPFPSVKHVVIDSAPGQFYISDLPEGYNFVLAFLGVKNPLAKVAVAVASIPVVAIVSAWYAACGFFLPSRNMTTAYWNGLIEGARSLKCPHLLLYSSDDPVVSANHVREFAKRLGSSEEKGGGGVPVTTKEWEVSQHVGHWKCHPEEYMQCVREFLEK